MPPKIPKIVQDAMKDAILDYVINGFQEMTGGQNSRATQVFDRKGHASVNSVIGVIKNMINGDDKILNEIKDAMHDGMKQNFETFMNNTEKRMTEILQQKPELLKQYSIDEALSQSETVGTFLKEQQRSKEVENVLKSELLKQKLGIIAPELLQTIQDNIKVDTVQNDKSTPNSTPSVAKARSQGPENSRD